ncbi:hypothetical protein ALC56_01994, partial [Trachymyrmex septentrionalis]
EFKVKFKILDKSKNLSPNNVLDIEQYTRTNRRKKYTKDHGRFFQCGFYFNQISKSSTLENHLHTHFIPKPLACRQRYQSLRVHKFIHIINTKPYEYLTCGKSFPKPNSFRTRVLVHTIDLPFAVDLKEHILSHNSKLVNILTTSSRLVKEDVCLIKLFCYKRSHCLQCFCYLSSFPLLRP